MSNFKPMLAAKLEEKDLAGLSYPLLGSPKFDGIRCFVKGGVAYSRNMKPIRNKWVQKCIGLKKYEGYDGELIVGPPTGAGVYLRSTAVTAFEGEPDFTFWVFDKYDPRWGRWQRLLKTTALAQCVNRVPHELLQSADAVLAHEKKLLDLGFEGIMLSDPAGPYKCGRSTLREGYLMKLKRFRDGEAVVVELEEAEENTNTATRDELGRTKRSSAKAGLVGKGMVGTIIGKDVKTGKLLRCGPGTMTHAERTEVWRKWTTSAYDGRGRMFTYRVFDYGAKDTPRFPLFHGWREDL